MFDKINSEQLKEEFFTNLDNLYFMDFDGEEYRFRRIRGFAIDFFLKEIEKGRDVYILNLEDGEPKSTVVPITEIGKYVSDEYKSSEGPIFEPVESRVHYKNAPSTFQQPLNYRKGRRTDEEKLQYILDYEEHGAKFVQEKYHLQYRESASVMYRRYKKQLSL